MPQQTVHINMFQTDLRLVSKNLSSITDHDIFLVAMKSGKWHGRYDDDCDMSFPTSSKQKKNTPNTTSKKKNKKRKDDVAKNSRCIERKSGPPNTGVSKAETRERSLIDSEISKKTMKLELFPVEILAHIFEQVRCPYR